MELSKLLYDKRDLLVKTFATLLVQGLITFYAMKQHVKEHKPRYTLGVWILLFVLLIVMGVVSMPLWMKGVLFCIFSYGWGYCLSSLSVREEDLTSAIVGTLGIFGIMFAIGVGMLLSGIRLGIRTGIVLFYLLLGLILAMLFQVSQTILPLIGVLLFSVYILYDTNTILQNNYGGDFITASLDYYLDILNLVTNLLYLQDI